VSTTILVLEFTTSVGGVQSVLTNILPKLALTHRILYLNAYHHRLDDIVAELPGVQVIDMPLRGVGRTVGWSRKWLRPFILLSLGPLYALYLSRVARMAKRSGVRLLYVHSKKALMAAVLVRAMSHIPYVYHAHGFSSSHDITPPFRAAIMSAIGVIAVSNDVAEKLVSAGIPRASIRVVYNGLDLTRTSELADETVTGPWSTATQDDTASGHTVFLFVGSIQENKGVHVLLDAFLELSRCRNDIELWIAGRVPEGGDQSYLDGLKKKATAQSGTRVAFLGWLPNVWPYLARADVLVLPSVVAESFGMAAAEAMSLGKPVIGSNVGGIPEVVEAGRSGLLVEPGSVSDLRNAMERLAGNPDLARMLGVSARESVLARFCVEQQVLALENTMDAWLR
jgi:glycosyltransferase involved in cell wall biosynthesis